jgi:hypothetical protein
MLNGYESKKRKSNLKSTLSFEKSDLKYFVKKNKPCSKSNCDCNKWHFEQIENILQPISKCKYGISCGKRCYHSEKECNKNCCKFVHFDDIIILEDEQSVSQFCEKFKV